MDPEDADSENHEQASISAAEHRGLLARIATLRAENERLRKALCLFKAAINGGEVRADFAGQMLLGEAIVAADDALAARGEG